MTTRAELVAFARTLIGTRWEHRGRTPCLALDCAGVPICVARKFGIFPPAFDVPDYTMTPDGRMMQWCEKHMGSKVPKRLLVPGLMIVMQIVDQPQHIGVTGDYKDGGLSIIHASNSPSTRPARVVETRLMWHRAQKFIAAFEFPGVSE